MLQDGDADDALVPDDDDDSASTTDDDDVSDDASDDDAPDAAHGGAAADGDGGGARRSLRRKSPAASHRKRGGCRRSLGAGKKGKIPRGASVRFRDDDAGDAGGADGADGGGFGGLSRAPRSTRTLAREETHAAELSLGNRLARLTSLRKVRSTWFWRRIGFVLRCALRGATPALSPRAVL